jgi:hypothetical protein
MNLHTPREFHFGSWSPRGVLNLQKAIVGVKTQWLEEFFISLKFFWNVNILNGFASFIWTSETQVMAKRRVGSQIGNLIPDH